VWRGKDIDENTRSSISFDYSKTMNNLPTLNNLDSFDPLFDDEATELVEDDNSIKPYDPRLIRVEPKMFSLRNIMDMIDEGDLDLAPDFQRLRVWKPWQKSRLIESVLLRIPLPAFYFASDDDGKLQVVDGVQRLSTIYNFVRGEHKYKFALTNLEYLENEVGGLYFDSIKSSAWAKRIYSTQIVANVIDPQTPMRVKFDIFKRINTGGTPLNAQEIRHCMSGRQSRAVLAKLAESEYFSYATGGKLYHHVRMGDREIILRALALHMLGLDGFLHAESMDDFLNNATQILDTASSDLINKIMHEFNHAMWLAGQIFGVHAFRKWPWESTRTHPINKAIFEALAAILCKTEATLALSRKEKIVDRYRTLCTEDDEFLISISQSTAAPSNVFERYTKLADLFDPEGDADDDEL
jgi:hypothetical protein